MMGMVDVKTADLIGPALDWAVATVEGLSIHALCPGGFAVNCEDYSPSTDWSQGGPLIQKHQIELAWDGVDGKAIWWKATHQDIVQFQMGETPLIAACRAIVAARLGDVVSVPAELLAESHN